jgi:hypothetical protein
MNENENQPAPTYESALQAVGAFLDSQCATEFKLLETPEGYAVQYEVARGDPESRVAFFRFEDLHQSGVEIGFLHKVRRPLGPADRQYRHLLGAIGHDLDSMNAVSILLDELPEALLITYEYDDPGRGYVLRKRMALAGPRDRERLMSDSQRRRTRLRPRAAAQWRPVMGGGAFG